jgi:hypothetical protein
MSSCLNEERRTHRQALEATRVLVLDGAMGTMLQKRQLTAADFGGAALEGCNENLVLTRPMSSQRFTALITSRAPILSRPIASAAPRSFSPSTAWKRKPMSSIGLPLNSVKLEDGEEKFELICPLARQYGAVLVVGCIDEDPVQAQAFTRERRRKLHWRRG